MATTKTNKTSLSNSEILFEMDEALTHSGLPKNQLNQLLRVVEERVRCDSECQRKRDIAALKKNWQKSEQEYKNLPDQIELNEKKYYTVSKGEEYYKNNILRKRYEEYIRKWENDQQAKFNDIKILMSTVLDNYTSETISKSRINQLYHDVLNKNKTLKNDIDQYYKQTLTSERNVYYENKEIDNLKYYRTIIRVVYYAVILAYILFGSFFKSDYKNWKIWLGLVVYIGLPFVLRYLINLVLDIYDAIPLAVGS